MKRMKDHSAGERFSASVWISTLLFFSTTGLAIGSQPNLTPYQPSGWSDKIVVARTTGTTTDSTGLTTADTLYVDWAVINNGTSATASSFNTTLYIDGVAKQLFTTSAPMNVNSYANIIGYSIGSLSAGTHTLEIIADSSSQIAESNESDNTYTKTITVSNPSRPNLTPYQPSGWSDKIVVARTSSSTTDSTGLTTADTLYVDWAVINNGNAATASSFNTTLYIDGVAKQSWSTAAPLNPTYYANVTGYSIASLSAGTHSLEIITDSGSQIAESNESDNTYTKTITVSNPAIPDLTPSKLGIWNDNIPIGTTQLAGNSTHSYSGTYYDNQTLYFNWASYNQGNATASGYTVHVEVTGTGGGTWNWSSLSTDPTYWTYLATDQAVGPLVAGSHTFKVWVDYNNNVSESNEGNNYYERTITVSSPSQPNLTPYQPSGWSDKIVVARTTGTTTDSTGLTTADTLYVDWAVINNGNAVVGSTFYTYLFVDGVQKYNWSTSPPLGTQVYTYALDYSIGSLSAGTHTITITTDYTGTIAESNEGDNTYTKTITVSNPSQPNLTPYQPSGWSDKIVVARTTGTTTDSTGLTTADTLYVDWAVLNNGSAATANLFYTQLYVDGVLKSTWNTPSPLNPTYYASVTGYSIGSLSAGTHTLEIITDSGSQIAESNESDNTYTKTITVYQGITIATLQNGNPVNNLSGAQGGQAFYKITVPSGQTSLNLSIAGGTGDCDMYVKYGALPTTSSYDYRPYVAGNNETVTVNNPAAGDWYIMLNGYAAYSGVTLLANYSTSLPDLTKSSDNISRTSGAPGDSFTMTVNVVNLGSVPSVATKVYFYFRTAPNDFSVGAKVGEINLPALNAGAVASGLQFTYTVPLNTSPGTYAFSYWIDGPGLVTEANENNNQWTWSNISISGTQIGTLQNNVPVNNLSGAQGGQAFYKITVPSGQTSLNLSIAGGTGDCDMYVKYGALPTTSSYDYRPYVAGNNETVTVNNPAAGDWYIMLNGYAAYSGVTLLAGYESVVVTSPTVLQNSTPVSGQSGASGSETFYEIVVPIGQSRLEITTTGGTGDCDLYVKLGSQPATSSYTYASTLADNNEIVTVFNPTPGIWFIMLKGASSYSGVTLNVRYGPSGGSTLFNAAANTMGAADIFSSRYAQGEKYLVYATGTVGLGAQVADLVDVGASVYVDLDDYIGVTPEGWNGGWVTVWLRGCADVVSAGFPVSVGIDSRDFNLTDNLPDREFPLEASLLNADAPGFEFSSVNFSTDGGVQSGGITLGTVGWSVSVFSIQSPSLSIEVQRQTLDSALSNAFSPGLSTGLIGSQMMIYLFDPGQSTTSNGQLGSIAWRFPVRIPSDKTDNSN